MISFLSDAGVVLEAMATGDSYEMKDSFSGSGVWIVGAGATIIGAVLVLLIYRLIPFLDKHFERLVMISTYLMMSGIIFVEVFRRFVLSEQAPWSTTLPPFLFLIMAWFGCAYNVRLRTHLAFSEFRTAMPRALQMSCLVLDFVLWFILCWIVVVTSTKVTVNSAANFQILLGTDNVMQWWLLISVPIAFIILAARALGNLLEDLSNFRTGEALIKPVIIGEG